MHSYRLKPTAIGSLLILGTLLAPPVRLLCAAPAAPTPAGGGSTPYTAVVSGATGVLSGPGRHYYRTGDLKAGDEVVVYREAGQFLAIRPPEGAFSWVRGADVESIAPGVGRVLRGGVPSRVGSTLADDRNVVHVRLSKGERVRVLARVLSDGVEWAQIAPPAGEFRWLPADAVVSVSAPIDPPRAGPDDGSAEPAPFLAGVRPVSHRAAADSSGRASASAAPAADAGPVGPAAGPNAFADRHAELEVALARRVSVAPTLWRLEDLQLDASRLLAVASNPAQQAAARAYAARVARFAELGQRSRDLAAGGLEALPVAQALEAGGPALPRGELVGELRPVISQRADAPKFALVDDRGAVVTLLTPQPGMDLQPLLGKQVSVRGSRDYLPAIRKPHIAATRVAQTAAPLSR